jgi:Na+-driven multidrug efflux pump
MTLQPTIERFLNMSNNSNNYQEIISISLPLVLSMAATTVMEFTDRVFLGTDCDSLYRADF